MKDERGDSEEVEITIEPDGAVVFHHLTRELLEAAGELDPCNPEISERIAILRKMESKS